MREARKTGGDPVAAGDGLEVSVGDDEMLLLFVLTVATSVASVIVAVPLVLRLERARVARRLAPAGAEGRFDGRMSDAAIAAPAPSKAGPVETRPSNPERQDPESVSPSSWRGLVAPVSAVMALAGIGIYALSPGFDAKSVPFNSSASGGTLAAVTPAPRTPASDGDRKGSAGLASVEELAQRLETRLQQNPRDPEGWRLLGLSYANSGRYADAAGAFAKAIEQNPTNADLHGARAEALVKAAAGRVETATSAAIDDGLKLAPGNPLLRYLKGLALQQSGDKRSAYAIWSEIVKQDDPKEPWAEDMKEQAAALGRDLGMAVPGQASSSEPGSAAAMMEFLQSRESRSASGGGPTGFAAGPAKSRDATPSEDSSAMVRSMVDSLAARLEQSPNDIDGWLKLMRSRVVLGETELAKQALDRALQVSGDDPSKREKVRSAAGQLGIR